MSAYLLFVLIVSVFSGCSKNERVVLQFNGSYTMDPNLNPLGETPICKGNSGI